MALQLTLEVEAVRLLPIITGETEAGIHEQSDVESIFKGTAWIAGVFDEDDSSVSLDFSDMLFSVNNVEDFPSIHGAYYRITKGEWYDEEPDTAFHGYVLDRMNESGEAAFCIAEQGLSPIREVEIIRSYYHGFHEAVNNQINLDGVDFVIGNEFSLNSIIDLVAREIARCYLRELDLY